MFDQNQIAEIMAYRHHVRLNGCWGGCYEVSCFIEHQFGHRRRDGVFRLTDGTPVFLHSWNEGPEALVIDATADQFGIGHDLALMRPEDPDRAYYSARYTAALNPKVTPWLDGRPYVGAADRDYWQRRYDERRLGPGWWLDDNHAYCNWLRDKAETYPMFAAKLVEYRSLGYAV